MNNNLQAQNKYFGAVNEQYQHNINDNDDNDSDDENLNQDGNNDIISEVSKDDASYNDWDFYDDDREDNQQSGYDSAGDWWNDSNNEGPKDDDINGSDDNHDPNTIPCLLRTSNALK